MKEFGVKNLGAFLLKFMEFADNEWPLQSVNIHSRRRTVVSSHRISMLKAPCFGLPTNVSRIAMFSRVPTVPDWILYPRNKIPVPQMDGFD